MADPTLPDQSIRVVVDPALEGDADCRECHGVGWTIDDPGGPLKDLPPMLPVRTCQTCFPGQQCGVATYRLALDETGRS